MDLFGDLSYNFSELTVQNETDESCQWTKIARLARRLPSILEKKMNSGKHILSVLIFPKLFLSSYKMYFINHLHLNICHI